MIPVNEPLLGKGELENVSDCVKSGWISSKGKYIDLFEKEFANYCGVKYGVTTTNGTTALHLALSALGIGKGDEVIMPTFTMIATAYAVMYTGARPVFVDSEGVTWNMEVSRLEKLINKRTRAIMPVHIYGHPANMGAINKLARKYGLYVIEDAAEAHGAEYYGRKCGSLGDIGCFSFYGNKIITTGEGGMLVTNNKKIAERARLLKDLAHSPKKRFLHTDLAYNYRMTNMQAAVGLAQVERIDTFLKKKREMAKIYAEELAEIEGIQLPAEEKWAKNVYWMYSVVVGKDFGMSRDELMKELSLRGVETRAFFIPMHRQPVIKKYGLVRKGDRFPVAERASRDGLYFPSGLGSSPDDFRKVSEILRCIKKEISGK